MTARAASVASEVLEIGERRVPVTSLGKVLYPATGFTKRDLIDYYLAIAPVLLPHLARRPVMLWRFPEGVDGPGWFQANCRSRPDWVAVHEVVGKRGDVLSYCLVEEPATLAWLANLGTIELHPFGWTVDRPGEPLALVLDLDPGPPAGLVECARVALLARRLLEADGLEPWVKTSGALGLHVLAPLPPRDSYARVKAYARAVAKRLAAEAPALVVGSIGRADRAGRVYVDWIQNDPNRQLVAPYSLRATPIPLVSVPVTWAAVEAVVESGRAGELRFAPASVLPAVRWRAP